MTVLLIGLFVQVGEAHASTSEGNVPIGAWKVSYYNNKTLNGTPVNSELINYASDGSLNVNYGDKAPMTGVNKDDFSSKSLTKMHIKSGDYVLRARADDGIKIYLDGKEVLNGWEIGSYKENAVKLHIANQNGSDLHLVEVQFFDNAAHAKLNVKFEPYNSQLTSGWIGEIYSNKTLSKVSGHPVVIVGGTNSLNKINELAFDWGSGSPSPMIPINDFSACFKKKLTLSSSAIYKIIVKADDGVRVFIDNKEVLNSWEISSYEKRESQQFLSKGTHDIRVEYFEQGGNAAIDFSMEKKPTFIGTSPTVHYNFGTSSPGQGLPKDDFYAYFDQSKTFGGKEYFVQTMMDDKGKVELDGKSVIDRKTNAAYAIDDALLGTLSGAHKLTTTSYDNYGYATTYSDIAEFGQWVTYFYNNDSLKGKPVNAKVFNSQSSDLLFANYGDNSPMDKVIKDHFSARYITYKHIKAGSYILRTFADDGVKVLIDGKTIVDGWKIGSYKENSVITQINNINGNDIHKIEVQYFDNKVHAKLDVKLEPFSSQITSGWYGEVYPNESLESDSVKPRVFLGGNDSLENSDNLNYNWGYGSPSNMTPANNFSIVFRKKINVPVSSLYKLNLQADDGVRVFVDDQKTPLIDSWKISAMGMRQAQFVLTKGVHNIKIEYFEHAGTSGIQLDLSKVPTFIGNGENVHYNFVGSPEAGIPKDDFYSYFDQSRSFDNQEYFVQTLLDDHGKVTVDGKTVINRKTNSAYTIDRAILGNLSGSHKITTQSYDNWGYATSYSDIAPFNSWVAYYYNNRDLSGKPVNGEVIPGNSEGTLTINNNDNSPMPGVNSDNFSARYSTYEHLPVGEYAIVAGADDGVKVLIDGKPVLTDWKTGAYKESVVKYHISNSKSNNDIHLIEVQYKDNAVHSKVTFKIIPLNSWTASYYNYRNGEQPSVTSNPVYSKRLQFSNDLYLLDNSGSGSPAPNVNADYYSAKYTATKYIPSGDYVFRARADDGIRVYLDGKLIIDRWTKGNYQENAVKVQVNDVDTLPLHKIEVQYFEATGDSIAYLRINKYKDEINSNDWLEEFYPNKNLSGTSIIKGGTMALHHEPSLNEDWGNGSPDSSIPSDSFSGRFQKIISIDQTGTYRFTLSANDGFKLFVDGNLKLDKWNGASDQKIDQPVNLSKGNHLIEIQYVDISGPANINLSYDLKLKKTFIYNYTPYNITLNEALNQQMNLIDYSKDLGPKTDVHPYSINGYIASGALIVNGTQGVIPNNNGAWNLRKCADVSANCSVIQVLREGESVTIKDKISANGMTWYYVNYVMDTWEIASKSDILKYLDPLNVDSSSNEFYQFLKLSQSAYLSEDEVNKNILYGKGILQGKADAFITAGATYHINEIYLIAHAMLETNNGKSELATGECYDPNTNEIYSDCSKGKKVYNMFGISAVDNNALLAGAAYAYKEGWFSPEKAIIGGSKWISDHYVNNPNYKQDTLYKMRWNPDDMVDNGRAGHQYATDVGWAAKQTYQFSKLYGMLTSYTNVYDIPRYQS